MKLLYCGIFNEREQQESLRWALRSICDEYHEINWATHPDINSFLSGNRFDVIFFQVQTDGVLDIEVVRKLRQSGCKMFNFTGDVRKEIPVFYFNMAPFVTSLFTNKTQADILSAAGFDSYYFQIGYNDHIYTPDIVVPCEYSPEIVFMGNNYNGLFELSGFRYDMVMWLKSVYGDKFSVFGSGWPDAVSLNTDQYKEAQVYRNCKIAVNCSHFNMTMYSSDRLFRILGSSAFCASHRFNGIYAMGFREGEHLKTWETFDHLKAIIDYYLVHDEARNKVAKAGHELCVKEYTWMKRMEQLKQLI